MPGEGEFSWVRESPTWIRGSDESRHEWPEYCDFRYWLAQKPPDPKWAKDNGYAIADGFAWDPVMEKCDSFQERIRKDFEHALDYYCEAMSRYVENAGYERRKETRRALLKQTEWLAFHQVGGGTLEDVVEEFKNGTVGKVRDAVAQLRKLLDLPSPKRARRKSPKIGSRKWSRSDFS